VIIGNLGHPLCERLWPIHNGRTYCIFNIRAMPIAYSTADVELPQRFAYWHEVVCRHCIPAASRTLTNVCFDAQLAVHEVGPLTVSTMRAPEHWWGREPQHLRTQPDDDLWIAFGDGEGVMAQNGHEAIIRGGNLLFYDAGRAFECQLTPREVFLVRIPRESLLQRFAGAERWVGHAMGENEPGVAPLRAMLLEAAQADFVASGAATVARYGNTLIDLLAVSLEMRDGAGANKAQRDLHARVQAYIQRHLDAPDLSLDLLAQAHGVSPRTVTRAFARHGQTAMGAVWRARLAASHAALIQGRVASVTDAAFQHGFADLSHFSRVFRQAYGCAPSSLLPPR
jgi:AraC-like DNA-binding protein